MTESILETKICKHCNSEFGITDKDLEFYEKVSPIFDSPNPLDSPPRGGGIKGGVKNLGNGKVKYLIPSPTLCPDCRLQRRLSFRNERKLYKRKCDATKKDIISIYSSDKDYKVFDQEYRWSDKWDAMTFGKDFQYNKGFFEQFKNLYDIVPKSALFTSYDKMYNSSYCNCAGSCKNCYLCFEGDHAEDCIYVNLFNEANIKDCVDCYSIRESSNCYESSNITKCYNVFFSDNSEECISCYFISHCKSCRDCFGCFNLIGKQYFIFNKQYSKEEYLEKLKYFNLGNYSNLEKYKKYIFDELSIKYPKKSFQGFNNENVSGEYIYNSKDSKNCFFSNDIENVSYGNLLSFLKDSRDHFSRGGFSQNTLECISVGINCNNILFCSKVWDNCSNMFYCEHCTSCSNCFGCVGLKNKSYCILNKQYEKSEYEKLIPKIIKNMIELGEWGEFFPSYLSPFGYNETVAEEYFSLNRNDVIHEEAGIYSKEKVIKGNNDSEILKSNNYKNDSKNFRELIDSGSSQEGQKGEEILGEKVYCHSEFDSESLKRKSLNKEKDPEINPPVPLSLPPLLKGDGGGLIHGVIFNRSDYESPITKVEKIIQATKLPEDISQIPDDIFNWAIIPEDVSNDSNRSLQKPFRIIKEELEFYRKHNLPIPRKHPEQRHSDRINLKSPSKLYNRKCDKCEKEIKTTYSPERRYIVYCEEFYNKEIY